jgi:hypothetical protein
MPYFSNWLYGITEHYGLREEYKPKELNKLLLEIFRPKREATEMEIEIIRKSMVCTSYQTAQC